MSDISITVTDDAIDGFEYAATISDVADIGRYFRMVFNAENPEPWKHGDDVIIDIIRRNPQPVGVDVEDYNDRIIEEMVEFEPQTLPDATALERIDEAAKSFDQLIDEAVGLLNADTELTTILTHLDEAKKTEYMGPVHVHLRLEQMIKDKPALIGLLPEPDTTKAMVEGTNEPFDKYERREISTSGKSVVKVRSRIKEIAERLSLAMASKKEAEVLKEKITKKEAIAFNASNKASFDATVSIIRRHFKLAVSLVHRFRQCEALTQLRVSYFKTIDGNVRVKVTPKPVAIVEIGNEVEKQGAYTVSQLVLMRPRNALKALLDNPALNSFDALVASATGRGTPEKNKEYPVPTKTEQLLTAINAVASARSNADLNKYMFAHITDDELSETVKSLTTLRDWFDTLLAVKPPSKGTRDKLITAAQQRATS